MQLVFQTTVWSDEKSIRKYALVSAMPVTCMLNVGRPDFSERVSVTIFIGRTVKGEALVVVAMLVMTVLLRALVFTERATEVAETPERVN